jgi:hypothetical protein
MWRECEKCVFFVGEKEIKEKRMEKISKKERGKERN